MDLVEPSPRMSWMKEVSECEKRWLPWNFLAWLLLRGIGDS